MSSGWDRRVRVFRQGEGQLIVVISRPAVVGLKHGLIAFERRVKGGKLGYGFLGEGEIVLINLDADGLITNRLGGGHRGP